MDRQLFSISLRNIPELAGIPRKTFLTVLLGGLCSLRGQPLLPMSASISAAAGWVSGGLEEIMGKEARGLGRFRRPVPVYF